MFLFVVVIVSFLHLYFSQKFYMDELLKKVEIVNSDFCTNKETEMYCKNSIYKVFPYILDSDNNIVFVTPRPQQNSIKIVVDGNYIKSYLYYLMLNLRFRSIDILLLSIVIAFAVIFIEYTKYYFKQDDAKRLENKKE